MANNNVPFEELRNSLLSKELQDVVKAHGEFTDNILFIFKDGEEIALTPELVLPSGL